MNEFCMQMYSKISRIAVDIVHSGSVNTNK